jgi:O-succinylbenzoic acid--CoA ligase
MIIGGAPVSIPLEEQIKEKVNGSDVYATFGMTETISHIALRKINGMDSQEFFEVLNGVEIRLDDEQCLEVKADVTDNKWLKTNDVAEVMSKGQFKWLGRRDFTINTGGVKVQPELIEKKLTMAFQSTRFEGSFLVVPLPDPKLGNKVTLVLEGSAIQDEAALLQAAKITLTKFEFPRAIRYLADFPRTESGKIKRKAVYEAIQRVK